MPDPTPSFDLSAATARRLTRGQWHGRPDRVRLTGAAIDSRRLRPGDLFACLPGTRADGHDYARASVDTGAALVLARRALPLSVPGHLRLRAVAGHRLLDDSYNANPASMVAGLRALADQPGPRLAVLGAMAELGPRSGDWHRHVGAAAAGLQLPLLTVGDAAAIGDGYRVAGGPHLEHAHDVADAAGRVLHRCAAPSSILVKASRSAGLDRLVGALLEAWRPAMATGGPA